MNEISIELNADATEVHRELKLMSDDAQVEFFNSNMQVRMTSHGLRSNASILEASISYLMNHWVAIAALGISVIALLKD